MENQNEQIPVSDFEDDAWIELDRKLGRDSVEPDAGDVIDEKDDLIKDIIEGKDSGEDEQDVEQEKQQESQPDEPLDEVEEDGGSLGDEDGSDSDNDSDSLDLDSNDVDHDSNIYNQTVKMPFGLPEMTVGEMKDVVVEVGRHRDESEKMRNEGIASREFAKDLISAIGELPPNAQQMIREYVEKDVRQQTELLLERVPEWNDNVTYTRESQEIAKIANDYGISDYEFSAIRDNRHIRILRDFTKAKTEVTQLQDRLKELQKQVDASKRQERSKGKKTMAKRQIQNNARSKIAELVKAGRTLDAIDTLIKG